MSLTHVETKHSTDGSRKFIFRTDDGLPLEVGLPINGSKKDIQVVPSHTGCHRGCTFCGLSKASGKVRKLVDSEILEALERAYEPKHRTRLISFMGAGDSLDNIGNVARVFNWHREARHTIATMFPVGVDLAKVEPALDGLDVKIHWSLHSPSSRVRRALMPQALPIEAVLPWLTERAKQLPVEAHYAIMAGVNDTVFDAIRLGRMLQGTRIKVRFLALSPCGYARSEVASDFALTVSQLGVETEWYTPPGLDIQASCGAFDVRLYGGRNAS